MAFIRQFAIARTVITATANLIEPAAIAAQRFSTRLAFLGRPLEDE